MTAKPRRKFWGWGHVGQGYSDADMLPFEAEFAEAFGTDRFTADPFPKAEDITLAAPRLAIPNSLKDVCTHDHWERLVHTYGQSFHEQLRRMAGDFAGAPDVVAFPRNEQDVADLLDWCARSDAAAIPFGGGSSVVGGVHPAVGDGFKATVSIDMARMDQVLEVDPISLAARIQAGVYGPHLEAQLKPHGLTMRYYPQSFEFSTLGGWLATRGGGHFATGWTHIDDQTESIRAVTPAGTHDSFRLPGSGAGPSQDRLFLGSEGSLGIITEAWMKVVKRPTFRNNAAVHFTNYWDGVQAVRAISQSGLNPANVRLLDHNECKYSGTGDGSTAVLILGFESADHPMDARMARAMECALDHKGFLPDESKAAQDDPRAGAAGRWREAFIKGGYLREMLTARGIIKETFETATTWDQFEGFYNAVHDATREAVERVTGQGAAVACRFTHVYPDGPAPYFTFIGQGKRGQMREQYDAVKNAASDAIIKHRGTITHHHAVGRDHMPWYEQQVSPVFTGALTGAKRAVDPAGIMNPGVLLRPQR